ncbi:MAG: hypothetical protein ACXW2L_21215, partial [Burkholderiales bacterium]
MPIECVAIIDSPFRALEQAVTCSVALDSPQVLAMDMKDIVPDVDPQETREWLEALESVLEREGPDRA